MSDSQERRIARQVQALLRDGNSSIRDRIFVLSLAFDLSFGQELVIDEVIDALDNQGFVAQAAIHALASRGFDAGQSETALLAVLDDTDLGSMFRSSAAFALGARQSERAAPSIKRYLQRATFGQASSAVTALGMMGPAARDSVSVLKEMIDQSTLSLPIHLHRIHVVAALRAITGESVSYEAALAGFATSADNEVSDAANEELSAVRYWRASPSK